jgi:hypothetical protein
MTPEKDLTPETGLTPSLTRLVEQARDAGDQASREYAGCPVLWTGMNAWAGAGIRNRGGEAMNRA